MNKEKAYKRLLQRQFLKTASPESSGIDRRMLVDMTTISGKIAVVEIKEKTLTPHLRRAHTVAEFNSWRNNKQHLHESHRGKSAIARQDPSTQFPPIINGRSIPRSALGHKGTHPHKVLQRTQSASAVLDTPTAKLDINALLTERRRYTSTGENAAELNFDIRNSLSTPNKVPSNSPNRDRNDVSDLRISPTLIKTAFHVNEADEIFPGRSKQLVKRPNLKSGSPKQVSFNETTQVSFIETYSVENEDNNLGLPKFAGPLSLIERNLEILEAIQSPEPSDNSGPLDTRLLSWLEERQVEEPNNNTPKNFTSKDSLKSNTDVTNIPEENEDNTSLGDSVGDDVFESGTGTGTGTSGGIR